MLNEYKFNTIWFYNCRDHHYILDCDNMLKFNGKIIFTSWDFFYLFNGKQQKRIDNLKRYEKYNFYILEIVPRNIYPWKISKNKYIQMSHFASDDFFSCEFNDTPINKICLSGSISSAYPERQIIAKYSQNNTNIINLCGKKINVEKYTQMLNKYICCIGTRVHNYIVLLQKIYEIPASGSLLLVHDDLTNELNKYGFRDRKECILYNDNNLNEITNYILDNNNKEIIDNIRKSGRSLVQNNYTEKHIIEFLRKILNI